MVGAAPPTAGPTATGINQVYTLTNNLSTPPFTEVASKPMCRYPAWPKYVGGSPGGGGSAANYTCVTD